MTSICLKYVSLFMVGVICTSSKSHWYKLQIEARRTLDFFFWTFSAIFPNLHILMAEKVAKKVAKKFQLNCLMCEV